MLPDYYEFQNSAKLLSGRFALENLPKELEGLAARRPLLLSDATLRKIGALKLVEDALLAGGVKPGGVYDRIPPDSSSLVVNEIAGLYRSLGCDSLVAVGGGSVLDTAKGVRMLISQEADDILSLQGCEILNRGVRVPFAAVPTTAGTGSEATLVAVILDPEHHVKMEFISYHLLPDVAVLDPRMTITLPPRVTASTGMDALCHAVEAYTCLQKNPISDAFASSAIALIRDQLLPAVRDGRNETARLALANASHMAGAAFSNSMVGLVHAVGHALGGVCRVPHGDAMNILLPWCMAYNRPKLDALYGELLLPLAGAEVYAATPPARRGQSAIDQIRALQEELHTLCGLPVTLRETAADRERFREVAQAALNDGALLVNPVAAGFEDILQILSQAW